MMTIKMILLKIALVMISNVHHILAARNYCENMLHDLKLFPGSGYQPGLMNFKHAYKNLSIDIIQARIDDSPNIFDNDELKSLIEKVAFAYFWYLLDGVMWRNEMELLFDTPMDWCRKKVYELIHAKTIPKKLPMKLEVEKCAGYIVPVLFRQEDIQYEKKRILKALYADWYFNKIESFNKDNTKEEDPNCEMPALMTYIYSLGYFTHVDEYIDHPIHSNDSNLFGSIRTFCQEKGHAIIDAHIEEIQLYFRNRTS